MRLSNVRLYTNVRLSNVRLYTNVRLSNVRLYTNVRLSTGVHATHAPTTYNTYVYTRL